MTLSRRTAMAGAAGGLAAALADMAGAGEPPRPGVDFFNPVDIFGAQTQRLGDRRQWDQRCDGIVGQALVEPSDFVGPARFYVVAGGPAGVEQEPFGRQHSTPPATEH